MRSQLAYGESYGELTCGTDTGVLVCEWSYRVNSVAGGFACSRTWSVSVRATAPFEHVCGPKYQTSFIETDV